MNDIYKKNINAIKKINDELFKKINNSEIPSWITFTEEGKNFTYNKAAKIFHAYSKQYKKELREIIKQNIFYKDTATILVGVGCGHLLKNIIKTMDKNHKIIIIEPILYLIKNVLSIYDLSKLIEKTQLVIITNEQELKISLEIFNEILCVQDWFIVGEEYTGHCEEYSEMLICAAKIIDQIRCNVGTVAGAGDIIAKNDIENIPYIIQHRGIKDLKNLYKKIPAVLIATGPSIENNIHLLTSVQDKAIIISIAQGLRMLLAYNIKPDFITTVDYGEVNYEHFKGLMNEEVPLVALNRTYSTILKHWQGTKFIAGTYVPGFEETAAGIIQKKGYLDSGGSVVHLSFQLAKLLGCDPIIFLGHGYDLSRGISHTRQVDAGGKIEIKNNFIKWKVDDPRSSLQDIEQNQGNLISLPGIFGKSSIVNIGLASFITTFEEMFRNSTETIINASEEGTDMKGTINMTFNKVINLHLSKNIDKTKILPLLSPDPEAEKEIKEIIPILKKDINNLEELKTKAHLGIKYADEMILYKDNNKKFKKATFLNTKYSNEAKKLARMNSLVNIAIYGASRRIQARDLNVKGKGKFLRKNLETRIKRNKLILNSVKESVKNLLPSYKKVLIILEKYQKTGDKSLLQTKIKEKINLRDTGKYFKIGNWSHPMIDARKKIKQNKHNIWNCIKKKLNLFEYKILNKAIQMKEISIRKAEEAIRKEKRQEKMDYHQLNEEAYKLGKEQKKFKESLILLKKAKEIFPDEYKARWGIATTLLLLHRVDKALIEYKSLMEDFPNIHRIQFEYGIALIDSGDIDKALYILNDVMKKTNEFDHFLKNIGKLYDLQGNNKEAKKAYKKYLEIYPADIEIKERWKTL